MKTIAGDIVEVRRSVLWAFLFVLLFGFVLLFRNIAWADLPWLEGVTGCEEYRTKVKERFGLGVDFAKLSPQQKDEISESIRVGCSEQFAHCHFSMCQNDAVSQNSDSEKSEPPSLPSWLAAEISCQQFIQEVKARYGSHAVSAPLSPEVRKERDLVLDLACSERFSKCNFLSCKRSAPVTPEPEKIVTPVESLPPELAQPEPTPPELESPEIMLPAPVIPSNAAPLESIPVEQPSSTTRPSDPAPEILPPPDPDATSSEVLPEDGAQVTPEVKPEEDPHVDMSVWEKRLQEKRERMLEEKFQQAILKWKATVEERRKLRQDQIKAQKAREAEKRIIWDRSIMPDMARPKKPKPQAPPPPSMSTPPASSPSPRVSGQISSPSGPPPTVPPAQQGMVPQQLPPQLQNLLPPGPNYLPPSPTKPRRRTE